MTSSKLRQPGTDPAIHDRGDRTPVGFIQNAFYSRRLAVIVEAVAVRVWDPQGQGSWKEEPEGFVRLAMGSRNGHGWAAGLADLTKEEALALAKGLEEQAARL